jgi:hypothetical protein
MLCLVATLGIARADDLDATVDPEFATFWDHFSEAVALDERDAVRDMTRLPIRLEGDSYDGQGFLERYDWLFTSSEKDCFLNETPRPDGDNYVLFCGDQVFVFGKDGGAYRFIDVGVND